MILFLDFDGVLHPDAAFLVKGRPMLKAEGELMMWAPLLENALAGFPEAHIVLSTSWARQLSFSRARRWLPEALNARVIGSTWHSAMSFKSEGFSSLATWWDEATRYQQIKRYALRAGLADWVAIDDQPDGWGAGDLDKLVHTNGETGLSDPLALALLAKRLAGIRKAEPC
jgi:HAD domain in Swiss Army Knife RNA repair proteins